MTKELAQEEQDRLKQQIDIVAGVEITLGTQTYRIRELNYGKAKAWRERFASILRIIPFHAKVLSSLSQEEIFSNKTVEIKKKASDEAEKKPPTEPLQINLASLIFNAVDILPQYPDLSVDLLLEYCKNSDRPIDVDDFYNNGTTSQVKAAFMEVLKLAYPLPLDLMGMMSGRQV